MTQDIHQSFRIGAEALAVSAGKYSAVHRQHGLTKDDWNLFTQSRHWTPEEARQIRSVMASVVEVSLTIAGMPAVPLPGHYVAAVIAICVAPANRFVACTKVPDTFDTFAASGIHEEIVVQPMRTETMMALVLAYSGNFGNEQPMSRLPEIVAETMKEESKK